MKAFVLIAFVAGTLADPLKFKDCEHSPFCVRFRAWSKLASRPERQLKLDNVNTDHAYSTGVVDFAFIVKSTAEAESNYGITISLNTASGVIRMRMDDSRISNPRKRYRIPDGDVIVPPKEGPLSRYTYTTSAEMTSIQVRNLYRIEIDHASFKLRVFNKLGNLVQVVNAKNTLAFEKYRKNAQEVCTDQRSDPACHPEINAAGAWDDTFGRFRDVKKYGPSLVGIDVEHVDSVSVHGLPEHTTGFKLPMSTDFRFFNADVFQYPLDSGSALYGSIPLLTSLHKNPSPSVSSLLWLNPSDTFVSLERSSSANILSSWVSETGIMDLAILVGPTPADILKQYHYLTGLPTLPPIFALGYQQSKWGYKSQEEVMAISQRFTSEKISLDVFWLDIQYTDDKKYFTWDPHHYGDPETLVGSLTKDERKLVTIIDPHIKADSSYPVFSALQLRDFFVKFPDSSIFAGDCWPGRSSYPDFTRPDVREYWGSLYSYNHFHGTSPDVWIWNDMNEPSVFDGPEMSFPRDLVHAGNIEHRELHNLYGMYYHRSTYEGLLKRDNMNIPRRPFVLSRSFFAGSHRFGPIWTGDNNSEWSHLKASIPMLLSLSISGMSFSGADVGGFFGDPSRELYIRWQQAAAAFYPFYRCHAHHDSKYREPWTFDAETTHLVRDAISLRYMMLPYWYTQFALYAIEGLPIIRPMWFDFMSKDSATFDPDEKLSTILENQLMVGDKILVRPIVEPAVHSVSVYLPDAKSWWYSLDGSKYFEGGKILDIPVTMETIPIFVKAGTILPLKKRRRMSTKKMKDDPYTFRVYESLVSYETPTGLLYVDDEETMDYAMHENFALIRLEFEGGELKLTRIGGNRDVDPGITAGIEVVNKNGLIAVKSLTSSTDSDQDNWIYLVIVVLALVAVALVAMTVLRRRQGRMTLPRSVHELVNLNSFNRED